MLRFIIHYAFLRWLLNLISIHLMLRFIFHIKRTIHNHMNFNTSHVTVYLPVSPRGCRDKEISIHLMLRFITNIIWSSIFFLKISIHLMLRFIARSLLHNAVQCRISIHLMLRFIIIRSRIWDRTLTNFNTSHVTVYRCHIIYTAIIFNFNTSHVTVYRSVRSWTPSGGMISIHLMLRFI